MFIVSMPNVSGSVGMACPYAEKAANTSVVIVNILIACLKFSAKV